MTVIFEIEIDADSAHEAESLIENIIKDVGINLDTTHADEDIRCDIGPPVLSPLGSWSCRVVYKRGKKKNYDRDDSGLARRIRDAMASPWEEDLTFREIQAGKTATKRTYSRSGLQSGSRFHSIRFATCRVPPEGMCFIATAACGSADAPDVRLLRVFRDSWLRRFPAGRLFIRCYETLSPQLANSISKSPIQRTVVRTLVVRPAAGIAKALFGLCQSDDETPK
ncbi:MAG TPA: hypothetical protein EYG03_06495 [Planctomycetes bacterium]|nr:hypothetical protein [Fuerstiella sp.]HIK91616.1 hypothetical protein [Planctomycetota bacterium]